MSIWMWIVVAVIGLIVLVVVLTALAEVILRFRGRSDERRLAENPDRIQRLADEGNTTLLLRALNSPSDKVSQEAARGLERLRDPSTIPALMWAYFHCQPTSDKSPYADALAAMPTEEVVSRILEKWENKKLESAIDLLRRFDLPAAREAVAKFDARHAEEKDEVARRDGVIAGLLTEEAESARTRLTFALPIHTGAGAAASKIVGGLLTGGMMAAGPNKYSLDDLVKLPGTCAFCSCLPGKKSKWANCTFKLTSAGWGLVGVNTIGEAYLTYKVCAGCSKHDEEAKALRISIEEDESKAVTVDVMVLNPEVADQIRRLNAESPIV